MLRRKGQSSGKKKSNSISEVLSHIDYLHDKSKRITYLLGYRSSEISRCFRQMIATCNSVSIVFLQFDLLQISLQVLHQAISTDICLFFEGESEDRVWFGRVLVYTNLGYLLQRCEDYQSSLKFLYDAESLLIEINKADLSVRDLAMGHALLTFVVLNKIQKIEEAENYLDLAIQEFNAVSKGQRRTRINEHGCNNLFCLLTLAGEIIQARKTGDYDEAKGNCEDILSQVEDTAGLSLVSSFLEHPCLERGIEILVSDDFQSLLFITCFFPFITPNTPVINYSELCRAQERAKRIPFGKEEIQDFLGADGDKDNYSLIMRDSISAVKQSKN